MFKKDFGKLPWEIAPKLDPMPEGEQWKKKAAEVFPGYTREAREARYAAKAALLAPASAEATQESLFAGLVW
jgi:hypothetical protein